MTDDAVTTPEVTDVEEQGQENLEATPAEGSEQRGTKQQGTAEERGQLDIIAELKKTDQIPKGVEPFRDENGELKFVIPINGKKYIANFKQVIGGFNLNQAGEQKLKAGKELEKKFNSLLENMSATNPNGKRELKKFLEKLGYRPDSLGEEFLSEAIEERQMSDEERAYRKRLKDIEEREAKLKDKEEEDKKKGETEEINRKQQAFSNEIVNALKARKLDAVNPELKKSIFGGVVAQMINARQADYNMPATEALDRVLQEYEMLLDNLQHLYSNEHMKRRLPKGFRELVNKLSLEETAPITTGGIHGGSIELEEYKVDEIKKKKLEKKPPQKIRLSEW